MGIDSPAGGIKGLIRRYGWPLPFAALVWFGWSDLGNLSWWAWAVIGAVVGMFAGWWLVLGLCQGAGRADDAMGAR